MSNAGWFIREEHWFGASFNPAACHSVPGCNIYGDPTRKNRRGKLVTGVAN